MAADPRTFDYFNRGEPFVFEAKSSTTPVDYWNRGEDFGGVIQISAVGDPVFPNAVSVP